MSTTDHPLNLAENLRQQLKARDLAIKDLSYSTQVPLKTIYGWLLGSPPRNLAHLKRIASTLGITVDELVFSDPGLKAERGGQGHSAVSEILETTRQIIELALKNLVTQPQVLQIHVSKDKNLTIFEARLQREDVDLLLGIHTDAYEHLRALSEALTRLHGLKSALKLKNL